MVLFCAGAATLALAFPAGTAAKVNIGEDTALPGNGSELCPAAGSACTFTQTQHPARPVVSPIDGVIVRWRMRAAVTGTFTLRVVRPLGGNTFTGAGASAPTPVVTGGERTLNTRVPIAAGDLIGVDVPNAGGVEIEERSTAGAVWNRFSPALADGGAPRFFDPANGSNQSLVLNADIEPDCDRDGFGDESQDFDKLSCDPPPCLGKAPTIVGTLGNDIISGTPGDDVILASNGDDRVLAGGGRDVVCGGKHKDRILGGAGRDRLLGELGKDVLLGEGGRDVLKGLGGRDKCKGGPGRDKGSSCEKARSVERNRRRP